MRKQRDFSFWSIKTESNYPIYTSETIPDSVGFGSFWIRYSEMPIPTGTIFLNSVVVPVIKH